MARECGFGYPGPMSSERASANGLKAAVNIGLPAGELPEDTVTGQPPSPWSSLTPFQVEDLLAGLPPVPDDRPQAVVETQTVAATVETPDPHGDPDQILLLTADFLAPPVETMPAPDLMDEAERSSVDEAERLSGMAEAIIAAHGGPPAGKGENLLPDALDALALLLADPPPEHDLVALDALYACWPKGSHDCASRALLAAALNLSRNFGLPGKLPMASCKAWRMLSAEIFQAEFAQRLIDTGNFIAEWQKTQRTFLILEFGEIELIEHLFETLHPGYHADLLVGVMNFKVLSNRRMGLLRRIPTRLKRQIGPLLPARKQEALVILAHAKALLERLTEPSGFAPIVETAGKTLEEVDKLMQATAALGPPPAAPTAGGGTALGRIG